MARSRKVLALIAVLATSAVFGCTSKAPSPSATPAPAVSLRVSSSPSASARSQIDAIEQAMAAYRGMWRAYNEAIEIPDPNSPELSRYATGTALQTLIKGLTWARDRGVRGTGEIVLSPLVSEISPAKNPTKIGIRDCSNDAGTHLVAKPGASPYADTPGGRRLCLATVELQPDSSWKVTSFGLRGVGTC